MKRLGILSAALAAVVLGGCGGSSSHGPLVVANFNPFSGPDASFGPEMIGGCVPRRAPCATTSRLRRRSGRTCSGCG
jgi:hypothetical protein